MKKNLKKKKTKIKKTSSVAGKSNKKSISKKEAVVGEKETLIEENETLAKKQGTSIAEKPFEEEAPAKEKGAMDGAAADSDALLVLETRDHISTEEERFIFYLVIAVSSAMTIWFGWQRNVTAALVFTLMIVLSLMFLRRDSNKVIVKLDNNALWFNEEKHNVFDLEHFWFTERFGVKYLNIKIKKAIIPILTIPFQEIDANQTRKAFLNFIPEISPEEIEQGTLEKYKKEGKNDDLDIDL